MRPKEHTSLEHDVKRLPWRGRWSASRRFSGRGVSERHRRPRAWPSLSARNFSRCPDVPCSLDSHEQGVDRQRCSCGSSRGRLTSQRPMSSFTAWCDGILLRQVSTALLSLSGCSQEKAGHGMVDALDSNEQGIESRCDAAVATTHHTPTSPPSPYTRPRALSVARHTTSSVPSTVRLLNFSLLSSSTPLSPPHGDRPLPSREARGWRHVLCPTNASHSYLHDHFFA